MIDVDNEHPATPRSEPMRHVIDFEDADTGDELTLRPELQYEVAATFVNVDDEDPDDLAIVVTYRVRLARHQFLVTHEGLDHVDLDDGSTDSISRDEIGRRIAELGDDTP